MTAYPIAGWPVALVPPAVQSVNGDAQHFRDIRQRHQLVTGLQRHDHLLSWRRLVNPGHWRGRSIQPCLRPDRLAAVHSPTCVSRIWRTFRSIKPLSHEAAACGREDRHRTGGAVILVWVGIMLVRMAEILRPLRPEAPRRASLDDLAGRQASWTRYRYPAVFGPVVTHLVTHRSVMAHTSRGAPPKRGGELIHGPEPRTHRKRPNGPDELVARGWSKLVTP